MRKVLIKKYLNNYFDVCLELWEGATYPCYSVSAYSKDGYYIGSCCTLSSLYEVYGICEDFTPRDLSVNDNIGVGFSPKHNKYYGWSQYGIKGFGLGDCIKKNEHGYVPSDWTELCQTCGYISGYYECKYKEYLDTELQEEPITCSQENCPRCLGMGGKKATTMEEVKQLALDYSRYYST